jgi:hypothetical protein
LTRIESYVHGGRGGFCFIPFLKNTLPATPTAYVPLLSVVYGYKWESSIMLHSGGIQE